FLCQSSAEKFIKGFLIAQGWALKKTHDILELLEFCADYDSALGATVAEGAILNEYISAGRYPGDITFEDIGKAEAEEALMAVQAIRTRVLELMAGK
ncbi:MAG: HEPN domain-containing protein, partial [Chloroflexota bacterium]